MIRNLNIPIDILIAPMTIIKTNSLYIVIIKYYLFCIHKYERLKFKKCI